MRYKEFNKNKVLEDCISLFWEKGFSGTPISAIVDHTSVNRFSLYNEFENKQGILYSALKLYKDRYSTEYIKELEHTDELVTILKRFFSRYLKRKETTPAGCFIIYTATELGDDDEQVKSILKSYLQEIEAKFNTLLKTDINYRDRSEVIVNNLTLLFCNAMCYCHIQTEKESQDFISLNLDIILK